MDIPSVLSEPATVYTRCWAWLLEETKLYTAPRQKKNLFLKMTHILTIRERVADSQFRLADGFCENDPTAKDGPQAFCNLCSSRRAAACQ